MRLGLGLSLTRRSSSFSPLSLSPLAWYDPSDLATLWQDTAATTPVTADGQAVARIDDKSGNGRHMTQATAAARPLYKTAGGLHWLEGDGVDDTMASAGTVNVTPGMTVAMAAKSLGTGSNSSYSTFAVRTSSANRLDLQVRSNATPFHRVTSIARISSGATLTVTGDVSTAAFAFVADARFDGAGLTLAYNDGNGANVVNTTAGVLTGSQADPVGLFADPAATFARAFYGGALYGSVLTAGDLAKLRTYMAAKAGFTL